MLRNLDFSYRMIRVRNGKFQWVSKYCCSFCKIDTMLLDIRLLFVRVPLEFHHDTASLGLILHTINDKINGKFLQLHHTSMKYAES